MTLKKATGNRPSPLDRKRRFTPLFDLERDGLTQGSINAFLTCPHQFWLKYVEGWTPKVYSSAMGFGLAYHDVLSQVNQGKELSKAIRDYGKEISPTHPTDKECQQVKLTLGINEVLMGYYLDWWRDIDAKKVWVAREKRFNFNHDTQGQGMLHEHVRLTGRWDGVFTFFPEKKGKGKPSDRVDFNYDGSGPLWLFETKTKSRIDEDGISMTLQYDLQTMLYSLAIRYIYGRDPEGLIYDLVQTPQLRQRQGGKGKPAESDAEFIKRIREDIEAGPGPNRAGGRTHKYFKRIELTLLPQDLDKWIERSLNPILRRIVRWWNGMKIGRERVGDKTIRDPFDNPEHYMDHNGLITKWGGRCDLFNMLTTGTTVGLQQRKVIYPELVD